MLKNYIKIAWRTLMHDKGFTALNVLSLTIGLTFSLLLFYYIQDEMSYDNYHTNGERLYRINSTLIEPDKTDNVAITSMKMATAVKQDFSEVEYATMVLNGENQTDLGYNNHQEFIGGVYYADSNYAKIFDLLLLVGDIKTALQEPNCIILSESTALKFFKSPAEALGKSLKSEGQTLYKITGVMQDMPQKSHLISNAFISMATIAEQFESPGNWGNFGAFTYALLYPNTDATAFEKKLTEIYPKYQQSIFEQFNVKIDYSIIKVEDIHLKSTALYEPEPLGNIDYVYTFAAVAILLLLIACINYMNLTTARSARRAKEIGIRKVAGSLQPQLVAQFLTESMLLAFISFVISIILIAVLLPTFNSLSGKTFTIGSLVQAKSFFYTVLIVLGAGFLGGSYPAFFLAKFDPLVVLKGKLSKASSNAGLRKSLVVVQFTISLVMLISTWIIYNQLSFLQNKDLGYNKENVLIVSLPSTESRNSNAVKLIKDRVAQLPFVKGASSSYYTPSGGGQNYNLFEIETDEGFKSQGLDNFGVDENYLNNFDIEIAEGRNFRPSDQADSCVNVLVNEAFVEKMGWGDIAIGKRIRNQGNEAQPFLYVMGVFKDFHMRSLYSEIAPLMLTYTHNNTSVQFKITEGKTAEAVKEVEKIYREIFPDEAYGYTFADEDFRSQFEEDQKRGTLFTTFSLLTILLAFLGLLGLIAYTTQQRKKEIAVRKVMGAESFQIVYLMTKSFMVLVLISCLLAFPIAYYFLSKWLDTFTFHTTISPLVFVSSAFIIIVLTMLTVSYHSIRAAVGNQVNAMRIE